VSRGLPGWVVRDIGYRATATAFSREALAAGFGIRERDLPQFPFTPVDPVA
jgi:oxalate decarboxylase